MRFDDERPMDPPGPRTAVDHGDVRGTRPRLAPKSVAPKSRAPKIEASKDRQLTTEGVDPGSRDPMIAAEVPVIGAPMTGGSTPENHASTIVDAVLGSADPTTGAPGPGSIEATIGVVGRPGSADPTIVAVGRAPEGPTAQSDRAAPSMEKPAALGKLNFNGMTCLKTPRRFGLGFV